MSKSRNAEVHLYIAVQGTDGAVIDVDVDYVIAIEADLEDPPDVEPRHFTTWIPSRGYIDIAWMLQLNAVREWVAIRISDQLWREVEQERIDGGKRGRAA